MKVKKISSAWKPAENPDLAIGEMIEVTDYTHLVRSGMGILCDESGQEIPLPGESLTCPICFKKLPGKLSEFTAHVANFHSPKAEEKEEVLPKGLAPEPVVPTVKELTTQEKREAALTKAREVRKANQLKKAEGVV